MNYDNDAQAALIQFASNAEARRAYSSPEAVLGNRFIKLFWHNKTKELPPMVGLLDSVLGRSYSGVRGCDTNPQGEYCVSKTRRFWP